MTGTSAALHLTVAGSVLIGLPVAWRALRAPAPADRPGQARWWCRPGCWLTVVTALLVANQLLFTLYALKVRHGDMSYLSRYTPKGWFVLADDRPMTWLAAHTPGAPLLSVCALRVSSLIELPFGMLAYFTILNWLDPRLYRRLTSTVVIALMSVSYSMTFGLIEWAIHTPYTTQNLVLRAISGVATVFALRRLGRLPSAPPGTGAPRTALELLAFAASTAALGYLVLALYDSVLLYSLGKAPAHLPGATAATLLLAAARLTATHLRRHPAAPAAAAPAAPAAAGIDTLVAGLSWWMALFLIPALAIRYELGFGSRLLAAVAGLLVIIAATYAALRDVHGRLPLIDRPAATRRWLLGLALAALVAVIAAAAGLAVPAQHTELRLLYCAAGFVLTAILVSAAWDSRRPPETISAPHA